MMAADEAIHTFWPSLFNTSMYLNTSQYPLNLTYTNDSLCTPAPPRQLGHFEIFRVTVDVFIVGVMCLVGFVGNALSIAVLYRDHDRKNTTNWLLQTLAVTDTLYLLACIFIQPLKGIHDYTDWAPGLRMAFPYIQPFMWVFASITQTITVWMVMLVTTDRYIAICKPLQLHLRSVERAKLAVIIIIVMSVIYNIPRMFERVIEISEDPCTKEEIVITKKTAFREDKLYFLLYKTLMYLVFRAVGPLVLLVVLNLKLVSTLQQVRSRHKDLSKNTRHRENITLMLVVVVTVFIVCATPDLTLRCLLMLTKYCNLPLNLQLMRYVNSLSNMLLTLNSSINFLIYCLIGKKFRRILRSMVCGAREAHVAEVSESEPLTTRTQVCKNGLVKDGDVSL